MRNILVTGGAGFIGSALIKKLLKKEKNLNIISLDNYFSGSKKNHIYNRDIKNNNNIKYIKASTLEIDNIKKINSLKKIDTIFHFGEFSRIVKSFKFKNKCLEFNQLGTSRVLNFALKKNAHLIYSASSSKFGNNGSDENLSPYSWTKSKNIELIKNFGKWFGLKYEILYFFNVFGPGQILKGEMIAVVGKFMQQYLEGKPLTVVRPGNQKRDFTHIEDLVDGIISAWKKKLNKEYLLGTKKNITILNLAKLFKTKYTFVKKLPGERFSSMTIKNNNAKKYLNYKPKIEIVEYIKQFIDENKKKKKRKKI